MERSDLSVGQLFMYSTKGNRNVPCRVVNIGEDRFTVAFFEADTNVFTYMSLKKGDPLTLQLSFDKLSYDYGQEDPWQDLLADVGFVKPSTKEEILNHYAGIVKIAEGIVKIKLDELREAIEDGIDAEQFLKEVRAKISKSMDIQVEVVHQFELDGMKLEVVCVHQRYENNLRGEEAIRRANVDDMVICSEEDWQHIYKNRADIPPELDKRWLATARPHPDYLLSVSWLGQNNQEWSEDGPNDLGAIWGNYALILRRRA